MAVATLTDVVNELKAGRRVGESTTEQVEILSDVVSRFINIMDARDDRDRMNREEDRREQTQNRRLPAPDANGNNPPPEPIGGVWDLIKSIVTGNLLALSLKNLAAYIFKPLAFVGRLLLRSGPLAIAVTALYMIFKDIGSNPAFQESIVRLRDVWTNKVVPLFFKLGEIFRALGSSEELSGALGVLQAGWRRFSSWITDTLIPVFQNTFIDGIDNLTTLLTGITDSIFMAIDGNWKGAILGFFGSIGTYIKDSMDTILTGILELFGVDFGPEGSLFTSIKTNILGLIQWLKDGFNSIGTFFSTTIPQWFDDTKTFISDKFWEIIEGTKKAIVDKFNELDISGRINGAIEAIKVKFDEIIDGFKGMIDYIAEIPGRVKDYLVSILPDWMKSEEPVAAPLLFDPIAKPRTKAEQDASLKSLSESFKSMVLPMPPTSAQRIESFTQSARPTGNSSPVIISNDNRRSSSVNSSSTNILGFGSPTNEYNPQ